MNDDQLVILCWSFAILHNLGNVYEYIQVQFYHHHMYVLLTKYHRHKILQFLVFSSGHDTNKWMQSILSLLFKDSIDALSLNFMAVKFRRNVRIFGKSSTQHQLLVWLSAITLSQVWIRCRKLCWAASPPQSPCCSLKISLKLSRSVKYPFYEILVMRANFIWALGLKLKLLQCVISSLSWSAVTSEPLATLYWVAEAGS